MNDRSLLKKRILDELFVSERATRRELIDKWELRPATFLNIVDELKHSGLIVEPDRKGKKTGRKASPLELNPDYAYFVGIELQIHHTYGVVMDFTGKIIAQSSIDSFGAKNAESAKKEVECCLDNLRKKIGKTWNLVKGVGMADPGLTDSRQGISVKAVNIEGWECIDTIGWLRDFLRIENINLYSSAVTRAFMEYQFGESRQDESRSLLCLELGTGIGGGFVKNGKPFIGDTSCAMELGHIIVASDGPLCHCGNNGCLEAVAGEAGIRREIERFLKNGVTTELNISDNVLEDFVVCVRKGDKVASNLAGTIADCIGKALCSAVALLNPSDIVLYGELTGIGDQLLFPIKQAIRYNCFPKAVEKLRILISKLDETASAQGAAIMSREKSLLEFFNAPV